MTTAPLSSLDRPIGLGHAVSSGCLCQLRRIEWQQAIEQTASAGPAKVAGGQKHEVAYEAKKTGAKHEEVRQAVKDAGNSRTKVEEKLKGGKR